MSQAQEEWAVQGRYKGGTVQGQFSDNEYVMTSSVAQAGSATMRQSVGLSPVNFVKTLCLFHNKFVKTL